ncbi:MAG: GDSL-type esterase/lipase family protein [Candidatus Binatia bacterium]|nr:GDSL-type esterase/lipase family protein [Candidatus Binatia bacterium]
MERNALIASIVLNVFLFASVLGLSYGWPLFIHVKQVLPKRERYVSFFAGAPAKSDDIVFVGDAITNEGRWSELFPGAPVKNRGIDGDTTEDVAFRIGQVAAGKPAKVFLMIGGGDAEAEKTVEETAASYAAILDRLEADTPDSQVFVQSILPRSVESWPSIEKRNLAIQKVASEHGAHYIDLVPLFAAENDAIRGDLSNDNAHLLGPGYEVWRNAITPQVGGDVG